MPSSRPVRKSLAAKRAAYRRVILECAEELFAEHGVDGTKVEDIARAAEIAPRTLYSVFEGKDSIVRELREDHTSALIDHVRERAREATSTLSQLRATNRGAIEYLLTHPHYLRIELFEGLAWGDPKSARSLSWRTSYDAFVRLFERCIADGCVRDGNPHAYARALLALQQSQLAQWVADGTPGDHERVIAESESLVLHAFCTREALDGMLP